MAIRDVQDMSEKEGEVIYLERIVVICATILSIGYVSAFLCEGNPKFLMAGIGWGMVLASHFL